MKILDYFENPQTFLKNRETLPDAVVKFMGSFFTILWEINPENLFYATDRFDLPHYYLLYMQSSTLFPKIMR
jgi:hypothetical protein